MRFKRNHLLFFLLLTGILLYNTGRAQTGTIDSLTLIEPPVADSTDQTDDEYDDDAYESQESYEDSVHRVETNAFDTLKSYGASPSWRKLPNNYIDNLKKDSKFDYIKDGIPKPDAVKLPQMGFLLDDIWIYIAIIVLLILLVWYLTANDLLFFRKKPATVQSAPSEELLKDIFSIEYAAAIKEALANQNYRLAIRLHYLQLLKSLSEKGIIQYQPDKTNFDYLLQIRSTAHYADFSGLTRQYEYSWYGLFPISQAQYDQVNQLFTNFHKKISG